MSAPTPHAAWRSNSIVIDSHTHVDPQYADLAVQIMDANNLQMMVDISAESFGARFEAMMDVVAKYPGRFAAYTGVNWEGFGTDGWAKRECDALAKAVDAGAVGIKLHKALGLLVRDQAGRLVAVDDERIAPIFEKAAELGCVVAMHIADPKAFFRPLTPENERWDELEHNPDWWFGDRTVYPYDWWRLIRQVEKVVARHPHTTIIGVHFGCAAEEIGYVADVMRDHPNYLVDIAARIGELGRFEPAFVREIFVEFQDRILFGTDMGVYDQLMLGAPQNFEPTVADTVKFYNDHWRFLETGDKQIDHPTPIQGRWKVDAIDLPRPVLEKLYYKNAQRYLFHQ